MKYIFCLILGFMINNAIAHDHDHNYYAKATLYDQTGNPVGKVKFSQQKDDVVVDVHVGNLTPGFHGFHIHAIGECISSPPAPPFGNLAPTLNC
jgi:Cu/Zn superoxide dismutase